jgi:DNA-binding transcriptional regulator YiaG
MEGTLNHNCQQSPVEMKATPDSPYHFDDSGLPNVYLTGIKYYMCALCNKIIKVEIPAVTELMNAIAGAIVTKSSPLVGKEVQFLRKRLGVKATDFARFIGSSPEQLSRWENGHNELSGAMDRFIRIAYTFMSRDEGLRGLMEKVKHQFVQWTTSIHGSGAGERITAELISANVWRAETELVAA